MSRYLFLQPQLKFFETKIISPFNQNFVICPTQNLLKHIYI